MTQPNALAAFTPGAPAPSQPVQPGGVRRVTDNVSMTDFNDESVKQYEFTLYTGKVGEIHRIQILRPDSIAKGRSHFHDKLKGGILCNSIYALSPDGKQETLVEERQCCRWLGSPGLRFAALVIQYGTDRNGNIVQPFSYELKLWRFGVDKYLQLRQINKDFPLSQHDLSVSCTDETYQKLQIGAKGQQPPGPCLLLNPGFPPAVKQQIEAWANASVPKLPRELGRIFENDQTLMQHLQQAGILSGGGTAPTPQMVRPGDAPVANFADIIGQVAPPSSGT